MDNKWCFMQTNGDDGWEDFPSYLPEIVPRILTFFQGFDQPITFFIVGVDATKSINRQALESIPGFGHEIASHSFLHQPWLHTYDAEKMNQELRNAEEAIEEVTGVRPRGFRGPGYSYTNDVLTVLASRGYTYDCSSFPNSLAGLARAYFFARNSLDRAEREKRGGLFGRTSEMFKSIRPYFCHTEAGRILEIPVTTLPVLRFPVHFSYVLYLSEYSEKLALAYFKFAMSLCKRVSVSPSLLFHPLDFMGADDGCREVSFFPGMKRSSAQKLSTLKDCMNVIYERFSPITIGEYASGYYSEFAETPAKSSAK